MGIFDLTWSSVNSWRICLGIWLETWVSTGDFTNYGDITWEIYNYKQLDMSELFGDWICYFDHHLERFMMRYTGRIVYKWVYNRLQLACLKLGCIPRSNHLNGNCWLITEFWCALFSDKAMYCGYVLYIIVYLSNHILGICVYHGIIMGYILGKYDGDILGIALWNVVRSNFFRKIMRCLYSIGIWIIEVKETCLPCCSHFWCWISGKSSCHNPQIFGSEQPCFPGFPVYCPRNVQDALLVGWLKCDPPVNIIQLR